ncbi:MAG: hypothetical protein KTV77_04565 [Wolbachia endosymbiont of Fragariocoptes setiger]|nr:hypothetical protein [Wolbachia endosymbiont of Fragariocoptes setiger]
MSNNQDETTPQSLLIKEYHDYNKDPNLMGFEFITTEEANAICEEESKNNISSDYKVVSYCIKPSHYME